MDQNADSEGTSPQTGSGPLPVSNLKELLKESLVEILRETPSLLQPSRETQQEGTLGKMPDETVVESLNLPVLPQSELQGSSGSTVTSVLKGDGTPETKSASQGGGASETQRVSGQREQSPSKGTKEGPHKPFLLSEGLPPVPAKLVTRILKGDFIDMAELLRDNLEAQRRGALQEASSASCASTSCSNTSRPRREVPDLLSWVQCFGIYTAVVASQHPERVQKLLAYQILIVREARRCGGKGWLSYDSYFRQQMAGDWRGEEWGRLNPYLFSSTFLALGNAHQPNCPLCLESDHQEDECALAKSKGTPLAKHAVSRDYPRESMSRVSKGKSPRTTICFSWNQGDCVYPYCKYRHICVRCGGEHKILHCRAIGSQADRRPVRDKEAKPVVDHHRPAQ